MIDAGAVPPAVALAVGVLTVAGAALALIGSIGLLRMKSFYDRLHPPTMGMTLGAAFILLGSMVLFSALESRPVLHEIAIGAFLLLTTPAAFILLVRAAMRRDSAEGRDPGGRGG
jgi:multicomponent K+:H+ antiporter subunit G